jgi:hypothetical protein
MLVVYTGLAHSGHHAALFGYAADPQRHRIAQEDSARHEMVIGNADGTFQYNAILVSGQCGWRFSVSDGLSPKASR